MPEKCALPRSEDKKQKGLPLNAAWRERLEALFLLEASSGSLHFALGSLVVDSGFPPHHAKSARVGGPGLAALRSR